MHPALLTTLRLMQFRAGPQDFPYSGTLTRAVIVAALATTFLQARLTLPTVPALVHAVLMLAVVAGFTWQLLAWRGMANRAQQTINSLLATGAAFTVLLLPLLVAIAPHMVRIAEDPNRASTEPLPALPFLGVLVLSVWNLAVSANIYRHALNVHILLGLGISLLCALVAAAFAGTISNLFLA